MPATLEERVAALEAEVAAIKAHGENSSLPWWKEIWGTFKNDPVYDEAMRLGREYHESLRELP